MRIAIIGGGISGLSAAYYLEQERASGAPVEYSLFEASDRLGGVMFSDKIGDCVVEGARTRSSPKSPGPISSAPNLASPTTSSAPTIRSASPTSSSRAAWFPCPMD